MSDNQFGLVYQGAITENLPGQVNIQPVSYTASSDVDIAANVYTPAGYSASSATAGYPAVVVAHPNSQRRGQGAGSRTVRPEAGGARLHHHCR